MPTKAIRPARSQHPECLSLAGFQVTLIGRIWASAEVTGSPYIYFLPFLSSFPLPFFFFSLKPEGKEDIETTCDARADPVTVPLRQTVAFGTREKLPGFAHED